MPHSTSWEPVAEWYHGMFAQEGIYQKEVILPNLLRLLALRKGEQILDIGCGNGFFAREFLKAGARVSGADISEKLVSFARANSPKEIDFHAASAGNLDFAADKNFDAAAIVLALQNMENVQGVLKEAARILKPRGRLMLVLNHPAFRIPQKSDWGWDEKTKTRYRRIDQYLSEARVNIKMHPGGDSSVETISFHRPLQFYFKALHKQGFAVTRLEEWNSHKKSERGPRAKAEDRARKEIPLFLFLEAKSAGQ